MTLTLFCVVFSCDEEALMTHWLELPQCHAGRERYCPLPFSPLISRVLHTSKAVSLLVMARLVQGVCYVCVCVCSYVCCLGEHRDVDDDLSSGQAPPRCLLVSADEWTKPCGCSAVLRRRFLWKLIEISSVWLLSSDVSDAERKRKGEDTQSAEDSLYCVPPCTRQSCGISRSVRFVGEVVKSIQRTSVG